MNNPIDFFKSLFKNRKTTLTGNEVVSLPYLHPEKGAINSGDYCTTQDIANLSPPYVLPADISVDSISELNSGQGVDIGPAVVYDNFFMMKATKQLQVDIIDETTTDEGVTIEGVLLKDGKVNPLYPKVYKAILTQNGTNPPTATVLNSTDVNYLGDLTWEYNGVGAYLASKVGITGTNTLVTISGAWMTLGNVLAYASSGTINIDTYNNTGVNENISPTISIIIEYYGA